MLRNSNHFRDISPLLDDRITLQRIAMYYDGRPAGGLTDDYELVTLGGAIYASPETPLGLRHRIRWLGHRGSSTAQHSASFFSRRDTRFRISYTAPDDVIIRSIKALRNLARRRILR